MVEEYPDYDSKTGGRRGDSGHALAELEVRRYGGFSSWAAGQQRGSGNSVSSSQEQIYRGYLNALSERGVNVRDYNADSGVKREILPLFFLRFRPDGKQSLERYTDTQVGFLAKKMRDKAKEQVDR